MKYINLNSMINAKLTTQFQCTAKPAC